MQEDITATKRVNSSLGMFIIGSAITQNPDIGQARFLLRHEGEAINPKAYNNFKGTDC